MWRAAAVLTAIAVFGCGPTLGCSPVGPFPGGALSGDVVNADVEDWSFTDEIENIQLESRPGDPYSVTVWCTAHDGRLYIGASRATTRWATNLTEDPRVRVRVDGRIYERLAVRVTDRTEATAVLEKLNAKYDVDLDPDELDSGALFRMEPRTEG